VSLILYTSGERPVRKLALGLVAAALLALSLIGFLSPYSGVTSVRAQTPSLIALPSSQTVYVGGVTWGPITTLNPFSTANDIDALELAPGIPAVLPVVSGYAAVLPCPRGELHSYLGHCARVAGLRA